MAIRNISFEKIGQEAQQSLLRFPFVLLSALCATFIWFMLVDNNSDEQSQLAAAFICAILGISWLFALTLMAERYFDTPPTRFLFPLVGAGLLITYYFSLPPRLDNTESILRLCLFFLITHLASSFAPYLKTTQRRGFWQYNQAIFIRILLSGLYTIVLYGGIAVALGALNVLFSANIEAKTFAQLWGIVAILFNTWFFLAGVPQNFEALEQDTSYPKGLKIFTQYVLLPLVTLYLSILYAYEIKILLQFDLPKGWVVYLILAFSIAGVLSLLLIHPMRETEGNKWIQIYARWFYLALIPLIILHFVAIIRRILDYGMTEPRYFVLVLGIWLLGLSMYFLFSKAQNIKVIPISLAVMAGLSSFGFWGAFYISNQSQLAILHQILENNQLLDKKGKLQKPPAKTKIKAEEAESIKSIIRYFVERQKESYLQTYFTISLDTLLKKQKRTWEKTSLILDKLPFREEVNFPAENNKRVQFSTGEDNYRNLLLKVSEFDYFMQCLITTDWENPKIATQKLNTPKQAQPLWIRLNPEGTFEIAQQEKGEALISCDIGSLVKSLLKKYPYNNYNISQEELTINIKEGDKKVRLAIKNIYLKIDKPEKVKILHVEAYMLFTLPNK